MWRIDWLRLLWWGRRGGIFGLPKQERCLPRIGREKEKLFVWPKATKLEDSEWAEVVLDGAGLGI